MSLTAKEAAALVGLSKGGIIKAIVRGDLSATKDRYGAWRIEPVELFRVYPAVTPASDPPSTPPVHTEGTPVHSQADTVSTELAILRERLAAKDAQLAGKDDLLAAKDEIIAELRQRVNLLITTTQPPAQPAPRVSLWRRLFGKRSP